MKKIAFVVTTINIPKLFDGYIENMIINKHTEDVYTAFIVVGDKKTPKECGTYVNSLQGENYKGIYLGLEWQKKFLSVYPELDELLPYNSLQRRNIGLLYAYQEGYEILIHLDDDNFSTNDDWVKYFSMVGERYNGKEVKSDTGWYNVCDLMEFSPSRVIYPRGFPHSKRWKKENLWWKESRGKRVVVNAGLWLESPDVDALTHCDGPVKALGFKNKNQSQVTLAKNTYCPFNTQNTAMHRDMLPVMYCMVMGKKIGDIYVERYDDIWMSYFAKKVADHFDDLVMFGRPFSAHIRNKHDFIVDMKNEADGIILTNKLIKSLAKVALTASDYGACYTELITQLEKLIDNDKSYNQMEKNYFFDLFKGMKVWIRICEKLTKENLCAVSI